MNAKSKTIAALFLCVALLLAGGYLLIGNPVVWMNNRRLGRAVRAVTAGTVTLNEVVPFSWDAVYTFGPYTSKQEIETAVGFKSAAIKANDINEGMVYLLFVRQDRVVACVLGYSANLGYRIDFASQVSFDEQAVFSVYPEDNVKILTHTEV